MQCSATPVNGKIVGDTADGQYQVIVVFFALRQNLIALVILEGFQLNHLALAIDTAKRTQLEGETVLMGMGAVADRIHIGIQGARRHFVQQGFPDMRVVAVQQQDFRLAFAPQFFPNFVASSNPPAPPPTITIFMKVPLA